MINITILTPILEIGVWEHLKIHAFLIKTRFVVLFFLCETFLFSSYLINGCDLIYNSNLTFQVVLRVQVIIITKFIPQPYMQQSRYM